MTKDDMIQSLTNMNVHDKLVIDRLSRRIQKLRSDKKLLLERLDEISFVFIDKISTPHYQREEWCFWYQCPKCHHYSIAEGYKFCPQCASKVSYINDYATHEEKKNSQSRCIE